MALIWYFKFNICQIKELEDELSNTKDEEELIILKYCKEILKYLNEELLKNKENSTQSSPEESKIDNQANSNIRYIPKFESKKLRSQFLKNGLTLCFWNIIKVEEYREIFEDRIKNKN